MKHNFSPKFSVILEGVAQAIRVAYYVKSYVHCEQSCCDLRQFPTELFVIFTEPEVSFNTTDIVVQESETHDVYGQFTIHRRGPDLSSRTVVCI